MERAGELVPATLGRGAGERGVQHLPSMASVRSTSMLVVGAVSGRNLEGEGVMLLVFKADANGRRLAM